MSRRTLELAALVLALAPTTTTAQQKVAPVPGATEARQLQQSGDYEGAAKAWRSVAEANPTAAGAWYNLGYSLHASGQLEEAVEAHRKAAGFQPFAANAGYNLACALSLLGREEAALDALHAAVDAGFANVSLMRTDTDLDPLRDSERFRSIAESIVLPLPRLLHFWIGEWDCYSAKTRKLNGRNDLVARVGDTVIHEIWTPVGGGPGGESWNYFDPASRTWRQHWIDPSGRAFVFVGTRKEGGILYEGPHLDGKPSPDRRRMFIRPIGDGRVQQTGTRSSDGGKTWSAEYDLVYVPRGEPYEAAPGQVARPAPEDPARQFDFLIGDWRMDVEQLDPDGKVVRRLTEWSRVRPVIGGAALIDDWNGSGFTVRTWDPREKVWRLFWTDRAGTAGRMQMWEGTFEDGVGTFVGGTALPSGSTGIRSRIRFSEIEDDSVLWKMWKSPDGGETWVLDYVRRYQRVSE